MSFKIDASKLQNGLLEFADKADMAIRIYGETSAIKLQDEARKNAKWTDRTGHARQRLKGSCYKIKTGYRLQLAHGVNYGVWLELAMEKKYAIIEPTIRFVGTYEIIPGLSKLLERLGG